MGYDGIQWGEETIKTRVDMLLYLFFADGYVGGHYPVSINPVRIPWVKDTETTGERGLSECGT